MLEKPLFQYIYFIKSINNTKSTTKNGTTRIVQRKISEVPNNTRVR